MGILDAVKKALQGGGSMGYTGKNYTPGKYTESDEIKRLQEQADYWNNQQLKDFTYDDFKDSQRTEDFWNRYNSLQGPGDFSFSKQQGMDDIWNQIQNREKFSYDVNGDALYQQYKDQYINQGKMAMMDTMGRAAAMTGGYGNSYAQSVGQQAYQGSLQQLTDKIPELYSLAMSKYQMEGDELLNKYGLYTDQFNREYGMHRDAVADYNTERGHLSDMWGKSHSMDMDTYNAGLNKAMAENESYNNNLVNQRDNVNAILNNLKTFEWSKYMGEEELTQMAINIANDNAYKTEQMAESKRQFDKQFEASTGYTTSGKKSTTFAKEDSFVPYTFSRVDADGNSIFYRDGKEYTYQQGINPYTGTKNDDAKNGTFSNGYQPDNVGGKKLSKSGITDVVNGVTQNVWKDTDGKLWIWDGTQNKYLRYEE